MAHGTLDKSGRRTFLSARFLLLTCLWGAKVIGLKSIKQSGHGGNDQQNTLCTNMFIFHVCFFLCVHHLERILHCGPSSANIKNYIEMGI